MKFTRELKTGLAALVIMTLSVWGYNYLKGHNLLDGSLNTYYTYYDNVQGLNTSSQVTMSGLVVGTVQSIDFQEVKQGKRLLKVSFSVRSDVQFSKNSIIKIYSASLMGGKNLAIVPSYDGAPAMDRSELKGEIESDMLASFGEKLNPLQSKLESVIVSADSLLVHINSLVDENTRKHIKATLVNLNYTTNHLKSISQQTDTLLLNNKSKIEKTLSNTAVIASNMKVFSDSLKQLPINQTVAKLNLTLDNLKSLSEKIKRERGLWVNWSMIKPYTTI